MNPIRTLILTAAGLITLAGCATRDAGRPDEFFTSGSREADQRATQRMARAEQLADAGEAEEVDENATLFERLGGVQGLTAIVDDFTARALQDPRVNWTRDNIERGGFLFGLGRGKSIAWEPTRENVATLKKHLVQFLSLTTGGPTQYDGESMKQVHAEMQITNAEFDAAIGDLKATLDKMRIADREQKELLAIVETTRPQVVTVR